MHSTTISKAAVCQFYSSSITVAGWPAAMFYCITKIVKIVNQAEIYIAYIQAHALILPTPAALRIIAKFHFRQGLTGNVHPRPLPNSHHPSFPALFLTIFVFQYFIICSNRILCCRSF